MRDRGRWARSRGTARVGVALWAAAAVLLSVPAVAPKPASAAAAIVMKMGTATLNDAQHEWLRRYKAAVERDSKGRISVEIYPASQLGPIPREIENTQFGAIQGWVGPTEFLTGVDQRFAVLSAPAVFRSAEQAQRTLDDPTFSKAFLELGADKGLKGISLFYDGENGITLRRPARRPDDLKGRKIRDYGGPMQAALMQQLGVTGVPMPLDQVLPALQTGAIDGVLSTIIVSTPFKYYSVAKYFLQLSPSTLTTEVVISKSWFDKLPPDLQTIVVENGRKVGRGLLPFTKNYVSEEIKTWNASGGEYIRLSPADQEELRARLANVASDVLKSEPDSKRLYDLLKQTANKYR